MKLIFYPDQPTASNKLYNLQQDVQDIPGPDVKFCYDNSPCELIIQENGINHQLRSVRKSFVATVNDHVNYFEPLTVDPKTYKGKFIRKSEKQNTKDAAICADNCEPELGYTYQRLINTYYSGYYVEYRVIVVFDQILITQRRKVNQFDYHKNDQAFIVQNKNLERWIKQANVYFGLDFGEYDILCDEHGCSIVDLNQCAGNGVYQSSIGDKVRTWIKCAFLEGIVA